MPGARTYLRTGWLIQSLWNPKTSTPPTPTTTASNLSIFRSKSGFTGDEHAATPMEIDSHWLTVNQWIQPPLVCVLLLTPRHPSIQCRTNQPNVAFNFGFDDWRLTVQGQPLTPGTWCWIIIASYSNRTALGPARAPPACDYTTYPSRAQGTPPFRTSFLLARSTPPFVLRTPFPGLISGVLTWCSSKAENDARIPPCLVVQCNQAAGSRPHAVVWLKTHKAFDSIPFTCKC